MEALRYVSRLRFYSQALLFFLLLTMPVLSHAEHVFPARDVLENGDPVSWYGSRTVFVGPYTWPDRQPLGVYNANGYQLETRADFIVSDCDLASSTCSTDSTLSFGGLPDGTQVKFVTTGKLPGGLVAWQEDHARVYYIRNWAGKRFRVAATPNGPPVEFDKNIHGSGKHGMSFAGYSHVMTFMAAHAMRFTCDPATDTCTTAEPHLFPENAQVFVYSTGALPDGLKVFEGGLYLGYCIADVTPTSFRLHSLPQPGAGCAPNLPLVKIKSKGRGVHYVYGVYIPGQASPAAKNLGVAFQSLSGYPKGTVLSWRGQDNMLLPPITIGGVPETDASMFAITMFAKVPSATAPADYRITVHTADERSKNLNPNTFQYTLHAIELSPVKRADPTSYPPIPGLKEWEHIMTASTDGGGADTTMYPRCANRKYPDAPLGWALPDGGVTLKNTGVPYSAGYTPGGDQRVWFYNDDAFFRIAKYTGDRSWANCGLFLASAMRNRFLFDGPNSMPGYLLFPWAMVAAYRWTNDASYKEAIVKLADQGTYFRGTVDDFGMREHAFAFERRLARRDVTGEEDYNLPYYAEASLAQLYVNATHSPERVFNEPFMIGLAMRPLIRWYMISHDERIPVVIKLTLDRLWDDWYDKRVHHYLYNPEPTGPRCTFDCAKYTGAKLNNLVSPAFAWYWRLTGDDTYRVRGDDLFSHLYSEGTPYSAKEWSQGFYWSFDFVEWREGKKPAY